VKQIRSTIIADIAGTQTAFSFILGMPGRARIHAVTVVQKAGSKDGFTLRLFSQKAAAGTINFPAVDPSPPTSTISRDLFIAIPDIVVAAGSSDGFFRDSLGVPYVNVANDPRNRVEEAYCVLTPTTPNAGKGWDVQVVYSEADA
jgi:hypothetical protein